MTILYVTPMWTGLREALFNGSMELLGMPAFMRPLRALIAKGHSVELFLIENERKRAINCEIDWLKALNIAARFHWRDGALDFLPNVARSSFSLMKVMVQGKYDFVYLHGSISAIAGCFAAAARIPFGHRLYGTVMFLGKVERMGLLGALLSSPMVALSLLMPKSFLLVTDDGSKGDVLVSRLWKNKPPYNFLYWLNGVERIVNEEISERVPPGSMADLFSSNRPFIVYVARIERWKRQDFAIDILAELGHSGIEIDLVIAGQCNSREWKDFLDRKIRDLSLNGNVRYIGTVNPTQRTWLFRNAIASLSLYDISNLGNVFHEMLAAGAVIIGRNDGSLDSFIQHGINGFLVNAPPEGAKIVEELLKDRQKRIDIGERAAKTSREKMESWDARITREVSMIEESVRQR